MIPMMADSGTSAHPSPAAPRPVRTLDPTYTVSQETVRLSAARPVRCERVRPPRGVRAHDHDYFEIFIVTSGSAVHLTSTYRRPLGRGSVGVLAPGEIHAIEGCDDVAIVNVYYLSEWLTQEVTSLRDQDRLGELFLRPALLGMARVAARGAGRGERVVPHFTLDERELLLVLAEVDAITGEGERGYPSRPYLRASLVKLMVTLERAYERSVLGGDLSGAAPLREEVWAVVTAVERALAGGRRFDPGEVAARYGIGRDHLGRLFRKATGASPGAYFTMRRVQAAAAALLDPAASVTDIALDLGFSDTAHLSREFRRRVGMTPSEYRVRYRAIEHVRTGPTASGPDSAGQSASASRSDRSPTDS